MRASAPDVSVITAVGCAATDRQAAAVGFRNPMSSGRWHFVRIIAWRNLMQTFFNSPSKHTSSNRRLAIIAMVAAVFCAQNAQAASGEKLIRTANGDVMQMQAPQGRQQRISSMPGHPFASAEQRNAVRPLIWPDAGKIDLQKPSPQSDTLLRAAQSSGSGDAPSLANYMARNQFPEVWKAIDADIARGATLKSNGTDVQPADGAHYPFYRFLGNYDTTQWLAPPWNKIGKLYFNTPGGGSSYCTASIASGNSALVTAGHCVYSRGAGWNYNFVFVPADRFGAAPYGSYGWQSATVLNDWINVGSRKSDVAVIRLSGEASSGQPVVNYVGWLGRSWNYGYEQWTYSHGYASNLSTQYTNICAGWTYSSAWEGDDVLAQGCDMTYGSSGGPWLISYTPNSHAGNYVNSVVSGPHIGAFGSAYVGARFSSYNIVPLCNAAGC
jgi:V8-like Glu-specific endopeptidase